MLLIVQVCQFAKAAAGGSVLDPLYQLSSSVGSRWNPSADLATNGPSKGPETDNQYSRLWLST